MDVDKVFGSDTVIGVALTAMGIAHFPELTANHSHEWSQNNCAMLKKRFAHLFRHGVAEAVIIVGTSGKQYRVQNMDELIRVWRSDGISRCFDMTTGALERILGDIVLHPVPELQTA